MLDQLIGKYDSSISCIAFMGGDAEPSYVNELAKYTHTQTDMKVLDFSRGDERYKKDFGGRSYFIKDFVVEKT